MFQGIIRPFSARVAALNAARTRTPVKGCLLLPTNLRVPPVHPKNPIQGHGSSHRELLSTATADSATQLGRTGTLATPQPMQALPQKASPAPPKQTLPPLRTPKPTEAPQPKQTLPPKATPAPPKQTLPPLHTPKPTAAVTALLRAFESTFTPQLPGLTTANVNARVSCQQHHISSKAKPVATAVIG